MIQTLLSGEVEFRVEAFGKCAWILRTVLVMYLDGILWARRRDRHGAIVRRLGETIHDALAQRLLLRRPGATVRAWYHWKDEEIWGKQKSYETDIDMGWGCRLSIFRRVTWWEVEFRVTSNGGVGGMPEERVKHMMATMGWTGGMAWSCRVSMRGFRYRGAGGLGARGIAAWIGNWELGIRCFFSLVLYLGQAFEDVIGSDDGWVARVCDVDHLISRGESEMQSSHLGLRECADGWGFDSCEDFWIEDLQHGRCGLVWKIHCRSVYIHSHWDGFAFGSRRIVHGLNGSILS